MGVCRISGECLKSVYKVSERFLQGDRKVSGKYLGVCKVALRALLG